MRSMVPVVLSLPKLKCGERLYWQALSTMSIFVRDSEHLGWCGTLVFSYINDGLSAMRILRELFLRHLRFLWPVLLFLAFRDHTQRHEERPPTYFVSNIFF